MSNDLPINELLGLALDWLIGEAMGYNLAILERVYAGVSLP